MLEVESIADNVKRSEAPWKFNANQGRNEHTFMLLFYAHLCFSIIFHKLYLFYFYFLHFILSFWHERKNKSMEIEMNKNYDKNKERENIVGPWQAKIESLQKNIMEPFFVFNPWNLILCCFYLVIFYKHYFTFYLIFFRCKMLHGGKYRPFFSQKSVTLELIVRF